MKMWLSQTRLVALFFGICLIGCAAFQGQRSSFNGIIPVSTLLECEKCPVVSPSVSARWIRQPEKLHPSIAKGINASGTSAMPWDSASEGLLIIQMGRQPTGGYGMSLAAPTALVNRGVAVVQVMWKRPSVGAIVTQVQTAPCLVVKLPREGLELIKIQDQEGRIRTETAVRD